MQRHRLEEADTMTVHTSAYVLLENYVEADVQDKLVRYVCDHECSFIHSTVSNQNAGHRRSLVLHDFPEFAPLFRERIRATLPPVCAALGVAAFPIGDIECQLTAHNDDDFFKLHNDNGSPQTRERTLSYVFYFHKEPKGFRGGEFRLYHSQITEGRYECGEPVVDIAPINNSILFFLSYRHHEVLPVHCPSRRFADGRFTINGWVRQRQ
jgi:SM-20-related protein